MERGNLRIPVPGIPNTWVVIAWVGNLWELRSCTHPSGRIHDPVELFGKYDLQLDSHKTRFPVIESKNGGLPGLRPISPEVLEWVEELDQTQGVVRPVQDPRVVEWAESMFNPNKVVEWFLIYSRVRESGMRLAVQAGRERCTKELEKFYLGPGKRFHSPVPSKEDRRRWQDYWWNFMEGWKEVLQEYKEKELLWNR